ncbi:MAG TPA: hypothetical protein VGL36_35570 [Kribbella sp.]
MVDQTEGGADAFAGIVTVSGWRRVRARVQIVLTEPKGEAR